MGLDQYATGIHKETNEHKEIAYWRKHNALQGWMAELYEEKGGKLEFNCENLALDIDDLDRLEKDVSNVELPESSGFFFGSDSRFDDYKKEQTLTFIKDARRAIEDGYKVVYSAWY